MKYRTGDRCLSANRVGHGRESYGRWAKPAIEQLECRRLLARNTGVVNAEPPVELSAPYDPAYDPAILANAEAKIEAFRTYFDSVMATEHRRFVNMSIASTKDGVQLYNLQLGMDGVLSMFEATGDRVVLDMALEYATNVMDGAHVIEGGHYEADGFLDWEVTSGGQPRARRQGFLLYDFQIGSSLSRLARIIHEFESLQSDAALQKFGDELTDFVDEQIVFKWLDARNQRGWLETHYDVFGFWGDKTTHITNICHNLSAVMGAENSHCAGIEVELAEHFRSLLVKQDDGAFLWDIWAQLPADNFHRAPDTSHENRTATMISQLAADTFVFDRTDIEGLGKTFTQRIWNGRTDWEADPSIEDSPWFRNYIDGSDQSYRGALHADGPEGMSGFVYDGWVRLGQFVPEVQKAGESLLAFLQSCRFSVNAICQRNGSVFGRVALPGHLAKNLRVALDNAAPSAGQSSEQASGLGAAAAATLTNMERADLERAHLATTAANPNVIQHDASDIVEVDSQSALTGDTNHDGRVDFSDFLVLSSNYGQIDRVWSDGDFDGDHAVTLADFLALAENFAANSA